METTIAVEGDEAGRSRRPLADTGCSSERVLPQDLRRAMGVRFGDE